MCRTHWHLCISAPPADLALPLLMFGFEQMASAEVEHRKPESRTQADAELPPPASVQLQPVIQTFSRQTFSIWCSWFCQQGQGGKTDSQRVTLRLTLSRCLLPSSSTCCSMQHAACSTATCEQGTQQVVGTRVTHPWWLLPPQTHLYETISA